jgi:hypothetical protein
MSLHSKYIVLGPATSPRAIVFDEDLAHKDVAAGLGGRDNVLSAGFCTFEAADGRRVVVRCYGNSESLRKESRPIEDASLIRRRIVKDY